MLSITSSIWPGLMMSYPIVPLYLSVTGCGSAPTNKSLMYISEADSTQEYYFNYFPCHYFQLASCQIIHVLFCKLQKFSANIITGLHILLCQHVLVLLDTVLSHLWRESELASINVPPQYLLLVMVLCTGVQGWSSKIFSSSG